MGRAFVVVVALWVLPAFAQDTMDSFDPTPTATVRPQRTQRQRTQPQRQQPQQYQQPAQTADPYQYQYPSGATEDLGSSTTRKKETVVRTQYYFQPGAMKSAITFVPYYSFYTTETGSGGFRYQAVKFTEMVMQLTYEFGLSRNHTVGASLNYGNGETKYTYDSGAPEETSKESGLGDIGLIYKGLYPIRGMSFLYGLNFNYSGKKKLASSTASGDRTSGGMSFEPVAGIEYRLAQGHILGAKLSYLHRMERTATAQSTESDVKETGGSKYALTVFYENHWGNFYLTPFLGYGSQGEITLTSGTTSQAQKGFSIISYGADALYQFSKGLFGGIYYHGENRGAYSVGALDVLSYNVHQIGFTGRFIF